jgi:SAM-dependent methyltransferase
MSVIELGPADGILTGWLCNLGFRVTAIDFSPSMCASVRAEAPAAEVIEAEFLQYDFAEPYDIVLASAFVHLFPAPWDHRVLLKIGQLVSSQGCAFLSTTLHASASSGVFTKETCPSAPPRYRNHYTRPGFESLIERAGLRIVDFYQADDRLDTSKRWGNWVVRSAS